MTRSISTLLIALALTACSGIGPAPIEAPPAPISTPAPASWAAETPLPFDPAVQRGQLENGIRFYLRQHDEPRDRIELRLVVAAGSALEEQDQRGLAHFLEHMAFNGTEHFEKQELVSYLETTGMRFGPDINAYTSFDETVYMLTLPTDRPELIEKGFLILSDWARGITLDPEEVDKERGVVLEEWRLGRGAEARMWDRQYPILLKGSRYAERLPIGDPEIIEGAPVERLANFYRSWYRPELMAVVAVGHFEVEAIEGLLRQHFEGLHGPDIVPERPTFPVPAHEETLFDVVTDPEATQTRVEIYYKRDRRGESTVGDYYRSVLEGLYHSLLNDRLGELARLPDPPFLFAFSGSGGFVQPLEALYQVAGVPDGGVEVGVEALLTEVERIEEHGFHASELERARKQLLRQIDRAWLERDKRKSGSFAGEYARHFLDDEPSPGIEIERELMHELLPQVTLEELNQVASEWIAESSRVVLVRAPDSTAASLPDAERMAALLEEIRGGETEPWIDRVRDEPLLAELPAPGKVVTETSIEEIGVTEWTLQNGIRVILKPTDFKNDQILLNGFSFGGTSLVPEADWPSATFASAIVSEGGLGEFDKVELEKALAGKIARASVSLSELTEGASGSASPEDLETMFQLLYLRFTAPRRDEGAFRSMMARTRAWIEHRREDPAAIFGDRWQEVVSQSHPRRRPISPELLDEVSLDRALEIYRDRVADVGDFTFVFVGNLDLVSIRPLVEQYLGGLPSSGREESFVDPEIEPPSGQVDFEVRAGLEPKSSVRLFFHGDAEFSLEQVHQASSLGQALRIRLREVLREEMGRTYGVGVSSGVSDLPRPSYSTMISFGCAPEAVEESLAALEAELEKIRQNGPDAETVAKVQEAQRRQRELSLRENGFWAGVLQSYYRRGDDPRLILEYDRLVEGLSTESLQDAARRYLDPERSVLGVLYPEAEATPSPSSSP